MTVGESDDDESSGEEGEFVPSSWDQSLQPSKSSLKSPEREASIDVSIISLIGIFFNLLIMIFINVKKGKGGT